MGSDVMLAFIAFMGALVAGFFKMVAVQNKGQEKLSLAIAELAKQSERQSKAQEDTTEELKRGNDASEKRNGHLGELIVTAQTSVLDAMNVNTLNVRQSNVEHEHIEGVA